MVKKTFLVIESNNAEERIASAIDNEFGSFDEFDETCLAEDEKLTHYEVTVIVKEKYNQE